MDYREALDFLARCTDLEVSSSRRVLYRDFNLSRVAALLRFLGDPHLAVPVVHIAGTKGKGSTAAMVAAVLQAAGLRPGLYTSPHLHSVRERIAFCGNPVPEDDLISLVETLQLAAMEVNRNMNLGQLTTFELLTAVAFLYFRDVGADIAVVEVGLGGRLDATNVVSPQVCAITNISLDHTELLGDSLAAIAKEKAAIIKPGVPVVSGPQEVEALKIIESVTKELGSTLVVVGRDIEFNRGEHGLDGQEFSVVTKGRRYALRTRLLGDVQMENAATAIGVCE